MTITSDQLRALDAQDPLRPYRDAFTLREGLIYLDGNSLGALPKATRVRLQSVVDHEWGDGLISSWLTNGWIDAPRTVGSKIAGLIGARPHEVVVADSTSVNIFKLVVAALKAQPGRTRVISEPGNFPTDLYMLEGAISAIGGGHKLELVPREKIADAIDDDTALVLLTHVHYKTADMFDMPEITSVAHRHGVLILWDLSHSAGAVEVDLNAAGADFAVGCGYKYLNGGPGSPAFLFVAERHHGKMSSPLSGWMGHSAPFDFDDRYAPASGIDRFLCGTPPIIGLAALDAGVSLTAEVGMPQLVAKSAQLCETFMDLVEKRCSGLGLELVGPPRGQPRGSHVSYAHPDGYAIMRALIDADVIGDFRAPDIIRFGMTPLYLGFEDLGRAVDILHDILAERRWDRAEYKKRLAVS